MTKMYKESVAYRLLFLHSNFLFRRWFSSIEVNGRENIPENAAVIFAPNHQNAFVDAMALLSSSSRPIVFLARADLFKKKRVASFLHFLKIMPAYRMRDGIQNLKKNADSFDAAETVLMHKESFCLMPEGGQDEKRKLRPLVKGMFRIGFSVQDKYKDSDSVWIVPTGIDYSNYDHSGGHLIVNFDKPINMHDYYALYCEDAPVAQNKMRDELSRRMSPLMLDIRSDEHYDTFYVLTYIYNLDMLDQMGWDDNETNRLVARQRIAEALDSAADSGKYAAELSALDDLCARWRAANPDVESSAVAKEYGRQFDGSLLAALLYAVVMSPLAVFSTVVNGIPALLVQLGARNLASEGFAGSFRLAGTILLFPLFQLLWGIGVGPILFRHYGILPMLCFFAALVLSHSFSFRYYWNLKFLARRVRNLLHKDELTDAIADALRGLFRKMQENGENGAAPKV
jgi:1-acyl-sn-glycerol-3-phosphate acyltransferase